MCSFAIERKMTRGNKKQSILSSVEFSQKDDRLCFISKFQIVFEKLENLFQEKIEKSRYLSFKDF